MKILVCTDFSAAAAAGEREAAKRFPDASLIVFHVIDEDLLRRMGERTGKDPDGLRADMTNHADTRAEEIVQRLRSQGRRVQAEIATGSPAELALSAASRHAVDLIVFGVTPGAKVGRFRVELVRGTRVPLLIIPG
jgi:nucleotide-binding universal stress UspA family protein